MTPPAPWGGGRGYPPCLTRAGELRLRRGLGENERGERAGGSGETPLSVVPGEAWSVEGLTGGKIIERWRAGVQPEGTGRGFSR